MTNESITILQHQINMLKKSNYDLYQDKLKLLDEIKQTETDKYDHESHILIINMLQNQINDLEKSISSEDPYKIKELHKSNYKLEEEKDELQTKIDELLESNHNLWKEKDELQTKIDELLESNRDLWKEKDELQTKIDELLESNHDLWKEKDELQTKIDQLLETNCDL
jgi:chromosome segregation ATPase